MERPFIKFQNYFINLEAVVCIESTEDGGMAITLMNREHPIRLGPKEAAEFSQLVARYSLQLRDIAED